MNENLRSAEHETANLHLPLLVWALALTTARVQDEAVLSGQIADPHGSALLERTEGEVRVEAKSLLLSQSRELSQNYPNP